jgi:hypothetical protein
LSQEKEAKLYTMDTITITFPAVKINLSINGLSFNTLENMVFDISQNIARKVLGKALSDIDDKLKEARPRGTLINTGKKPKYFLTRLGDIRYLRTRYIDKATKKARYLLEEHLGLRKNQRISLMRAKIEMFIASITTYRATEKNVELLTGFRRSHEAIRQSVIKEAEGIINHQKCSLDKTRRLEDAEEYLPASLDIAYVETDATFIRLQRRRKIRSRRIYRRRKRRSLEIKLGIGYTDKVRRYDTGRGSALKLKDKFTYASALDGRSFMENLSIVAEKRLSLSRVKKVIFGGDGGPYITAGIKDYFPKAVYILSRFHLKRAIKTALALRPDMQYVITRLINKDKIDKALSLLWRLIQRPKDTKERVLLQDLYAYIRNNREGINPITHVEDKQVRDRIKGAGAMESNVDKFIAHRFKKRGMSWSVKGAQSLIKIKETIANDEWDLWWSEKRDEKIQINLEPLRQLTSKDFWKAQKNVAPLVEADIPALHGRDQSEPWAKVIRELQKIDYYKN